MTPGDFISATVGAKYEVGGRGPSFDCYGVVVRFYRDVMGVCLPEWDWDGGVLSAAKIIKAAAAVEFRKLPKPFDGCLVKADRGNLPAHVGIYYFGRVLHCAEKSGAVFEPISQFEMQFKTVEFYAPS